jgi:SagB-type dehydrogenase family enzyme
MRSKPMHIPPDPKRRTFLSTLLRLVGALGLAGCTLPNAGAPDGDAAPPRQASPDAEPIALPAPKLDGDLSLEAAIQARRSVREYDDAPLSLAELGQLLWSAQGITSPNGFRSAPSAGALYPLETYIAVGNVAELSPGIYHYAPAPHTLRLVATGDRLAEVTAAALFQRWIADSAVVIALAAVYRRTTRRYGERGIRYVHMEAGHAAQNIYLQAVALGLGTVVVGAFQDEATRAVLALPEDQEPLYLIPVGRMVT